jgi:hypothetical protein
MQLRSLFVLLCGLAGSAIAGCSKAPPQSPTTEAPKVSKAELLKKLDGEWVEKTSAVAREEGIFTEKPSEEGEKVIRINNGVAEVRIASGPWLKYATFSIGDGQHCLLRSQKDVSGQDRIMPLRYKIEGNTLITVHDKMYPDMFPDSFEMDGATAVERHRQMITYVKTDR